MVNILPIRSCWRVTSIVGKSNRRGGRYSVLGLSKLYHRRHNSTKINDNDVQCELGNNISRILTDEQRMLFNQVNQLSYMTRSLARQVGNVPVKEDR